MAAINFTKQSGVVSITSGGISKSYFGSVGKFSPNGSNDGFSVTIGNDNYQISLADLRVNGQAGETMSSAAVLLTAILGT